jgi:high affinity Mn2+ porin
MTLHRDRNLGKRPRRRARWALVVGLALASTVATPARAEVAEASGRADDAFDFMNFLAHRGLHDLDDEDWNAYGQITNIYNGKLGFHAKYTNLHGATNSLSPEHEGSFTESATLYLGLRLWPTAEAYIVPEIIGERALSGLHGLGGVIQNFELQKSGSTIPTPYLSRAYIRETLGLGGKRIDQTSDPSQLGGVSHSRRLVFTVGNFSLIDIFDKNDVEGDLTRSFLNMAFLTYSAYDFAADARGYTWGAVLELFYDDWGVRIGRAAPPKSPNQLPIDFRINQVYGDQVEMEHTHHLFGKDGTVRVLGYRNVENMGRFADAIAAFEQNHALDAANCGNAFNYGSADASAPDLCFVRRLNVKLGIGASLEQQITGDLGVFFRGMYSDGQTEVYSYTSADRSISVGAVSKGSLWKRPGDTVGVGWGQGWISSIHAQYLGMGGVDGFIGDGKINQASEGIVEVFYSFSLGSSAWFTPDYQHIWNPAFNADRGPVDIFGARLHVEF